jgi:transposase-like protein
VKHGRNPPGSQRYLCQGCKRTYTPEPTPYGYDAATRRQALRLYTDGLNLWRIARQLGVVHTMLRLPADLAAQIRRCAVHERSGWRAGI